MAVFQLSEDLVFPNITLAEPDGLLAIGGDLSTDRLILAYESGIFPWYSNGQPILWWSPNPRFVLNVDQVKTSRSLRRVFNSGAFEFTINQAFIEVIDNCQSIKRKGQPGTWITDEMKEAYCKLHELGSAYSFEAWHEERLVGGMYGVYCKHYFAGESMFSLMSNASKFVLIRTCQFLKKSGIEILDCQVYSDHLKRMGAENITREEFSKYLTYYN